MVNKIDFDTVFTPFCKWLSENFEVKQKNIIRAGVVIKKPISKYMGLDYCCATDFNISDTFNNKNTLKYLLEDADGSEFEGYTLQHIVFMKIFKFGLDYGREVEAGRLDNNRFINKRWNKNINPDLEEDD